MWCAVYCGGCVELETRTTASSGKEDFLEVSLMRAGKMKDEGGINIGPLWAPRTLSVKTNGLTDVFLTVYCLLFCLPKIIQIK